MNIVSELLERKNWGQSLLIILFLIYLISGYKLPYGLATLIDTIWGKVIIIIIVFILFALCNPILGILGFFVAYKLLMSSTIETGTYGKEHYIPGEEKKYAEMINHNKFPYTLEQEIVTLRAPIYKYDSDNTKYSFNPTLDDQHEAASIHYNGVI
jgi:predicted membrane protein